jgi:hypothetical protein
MPTIIDGGHADDEDTRARRRERSEDGGGAAREAMRVASRLISTYSTVNIPDFTLYMSRPSGSACEFGFRSLSMTTIPDMTLSRSALMKETESGAASAATSEFDNSARRVPDREPSSTEGRCASCHIIF